MKGLRCCGLVSGLGSACGMQGQFHGSGCRIQDLGMGVGLGFRDYASFP